MISSVIVIVIKEETGMQLSICHTVVWVSDTNVTLALFFFHQYNHSLIHSFMSWFGLLFPGQRLLERLADVAAWCFADQTHLCYKIQTTITLLSKLCNEIRICCSAIQLRSSQKSQPFELRKKNISILNTSCRPRSREKSGFVHAINSS